MSGVLQGNGKNDGGRLRSWRRILVLAVVMCVSLSAMFFSAWQAEAAVAGAITDLKVSGIGYDQITLGWTTPNDGGSAITEYEIQQNSNAWTAISGSDAGTVDHTVTGLTPGTSDTFKVRAVNGDGNAPESNTVTVIPNKFAHNIPDGLTLADHDSFGSSTALSSDGATLVVGAHRDDTGGVSAGAVHLFTKTGSTWTHSVKIDDNFTGLILGTTDSFGSAAALSSDGATLAVGAYGDDTGGDNRGAVHLFTKISDIWTYNTRMAHGSNGLILADDSWFGSSAALSTDGTTLAVGAYGDDTGGTNRGAVHLFTKNGDTWTHSVKIDNDFTGLTLADGDYFNSVALSSDGTTLAVGAHGDDTGGNNKGAVHLFTKNGGIWTHSVKIDNDFTGITLNNGGFFGSSTALSPEGTTLAVGATTDNAGKGTVYLFNKHGTQWTYHSKIADGSHGLTLSNGDHFGTSMALSSNGATLAVGALDDDTGGTGTNASRGAAHLFNFTDTIPPYIVTQTFTNSTPANGKYPKTGDNLTFSFTFSETLQTTPTVTIEGTSATFSESTGTYTATYQVTDATAEGPIVYNIGTLTDSAGQSFDPPETNSPFIVDRIAPTLAVITDGTSGADSYIGTTPDTTPDFSFTSNEAGTIDYAGDCTSSETTAVNGTNTVSFSTLAEATYTNCAVTVTDEAGNISNSLAVPSFTIDTSASPIAITGPGAAYATGQTVSATTSSVTDEDWEYQLIDGGTDCTGTTTGTFAAYTAGTALTYGTDASPAVTTDADDGKKVCFKLTDTKGTATDTTDDQIHYLASGILRLDNAAPTLTTIADNISGIDSYIGTTTDTTPDFSFTSDEAGTITYTGSCTSSETTAVSGTNTVSFNALVYDITYANCAVKVTDEVGNISSSLAVPNFTIRRVPEAIDDLVVSGIGYDQITLGWTTPDNEGSAITEYEIQQNSNTWTTISGSDAGTVSHTVTGLTPGTSDTFKVRAVNTDGAAPDSNIVTVIPNKFADTIPDGLTLTNYDYFGASATLSSDGTTLAVGAWGDDIGGNNTGAVHLFTKNGGTWAHSVKIDDNFTEFTLDNGDHFGSATALSPNGTILAVGAKGHNAVHIFTKSGDTWTHSVKIDNDFAELTLDVDDWFGSSAALSSDGMLAVGAENDDTGGANTNRGAVYLFTKNGNTWTHSVKIDSDFAGLTLSNNNQFGSAIAFSSDGTTFVVGAQSNNTGGTSRGAVHIFTKSNDIWTHSVTIDNDFTGLALTDHDTFGSSVALSSNGTALAVGAELDDTGGEDRGAVHLFNKHGTQWIYHSKIADGSHGLTLSNGDHFGTSTALSSDGTLVVGALGDDTGGTGTNASRGAAHLFNFTDTIPPYIVTQTFTNSTPANGKYPKTGDNLTFSFTFSETLQTTPTVTIEGTSATFSESTGTYTATYQVTDATAEGPIVYNIGTLTDSAGQSFDPPETNSPFIVDRIAPTLAVITDGTSGADSYIGTTPDTTPDFSFTSNEAGTIDYAGDCTSSETTAVNGTNTVSFSTLAEATYTNCAVTVTDEAGNISNSLAVPSFTIDTSASPIAITGPGAAYATGQTVSATTSSVTDEDWEYQLIDGGTDCTGTTTGTFAAYTAGTALTYGTDASPAVTTDADDGKKVCFKLTDTKGTASDTTDDDIYYLASGILRLDNAAPTLTAITDGTSGGDTTIGGTLDITPDLSFTLSGLRLSETATLLWTGECTAESNTITSQTDAATDETITVTLNSDTEESGDFMEGSTITGCQVQVRDQVGNVSASLTIPSFTIVSQAPVFANTVNAVTYRKGVAIATLTLPGLRPDTGHGNITFDLSGLPTGTGLTFTAPTTATGTGSLTGNPNQADTDASPFTLTYTATDSAPSPIDPRVVTLTFGVTVTDFAVTVTDDADGSTPEREKELTVTVTDTSGVTNALWGMVDDIASCTASSNAQLTTAYTPSTSGTTITITDADANSKVACFRATYASNDYYGWSGVIGGIDRTNPVVNTVPLAGILTNTYLSSAEATNADAIVSPPTVSDTNTYTIAYAVVSDGTTCNASVTYSATVPNATDVPNSDGTYKVCASVTDAATNVGYGESATFTKDTTAPTISSVPLTGVLTDAYLDSGEVTNTNAIVGTVSHGETGTPTIGYAVVSDGTTCNAGVTYSATAPDATDVPNSDGTYKICVRVADAATNVGYGSSDPFVKDTTAPTVSSVPLTGVLGDTYLSSAEATNTNAIVGTPTVSDTSSYTIAYAVVSGSITCNAGVTYSTTAPDATDVSGLDGTYKVCVRATDAATNVGYGSSDPFVKDTASPTVSSVPLTGVLGDTYLSSAETADTNAIVGTVSHGETGTPTIGYAVVSDGTTCNAGVTYSTTAPNATDVSGPDGSYKICVRVTDAATNVGYSESATFIKDTTAPTVSSVPLTGVLGDTYLNSAETADTNAIVGTVSHGETGTPTIGYAVVSDGTTCNAGVTYTATAPKATAVSGSDGTYKICVRVTDAAGNAGFGGSQTFTKDTSAPTLTRTIAFNGENSHDNKVYLNQGDTITITVTANEDTQAGDKTVSLIIGSDTRSVTLTRGGANNRTYTGTYTVVSGETATYVEIETPDAANDIFNLAGNPAIPFEAGDRLADHITQITAVIVDTTPPSAPTIDLREADDTYGDIDHDGAYEAGTDFGTNNDNITSNTNPYYTFGAVENTNGVTLTLRYAGASCAEHTVSGGDYTPDVQCTAAQSDGEHAVTATVTDRAGNVSPAATALTVTIDTVDPPAMDIDLKSESDLGVSDTDNYTSSHDLTFTITGNTNSESLHAVLQKGATSQHNHPSAHADLSAPTGELTRNTGGTGDGENPVFKVLTHDLAGNTSLTATADAETVYLDYVTAVPSFTFNSAYDSGAKNNDSITNRRQLGFSIGNIEVKAANRGNGAEVTVYDNSGTGSTKGAAVSLTDEIGHEHAPVTAETHTTETQQTDFADGKHGFFVCQTDDAGNTSCTMNALNWIVDITPPASPTAPNLKAEDDSYGANANDARDGTDGDGVTNKQSDLTFASFASGQGTHTDGAHDHHQIRFYKWTDTNSDSTVDDGELAELKAPANNVADSSNIAETAGYGMSASGTEKNLYSASETLGEGVHRFVAKQYDIAGNLSAVSDPLEMRVDVTAPNPVTVILALHPLSDTGTSQADKQTSNVSPVFRFISGSTQSDDVDYYEVWRTRLAEGHTTPQGGETYAYPSSSDTAEQTSYEYSASDSSVERTTELGATYGDNAYQNGALIEISSMTVPHFNSYYAFKVYTVDLAGNYAAGTDSETIRILVPPPKPEKMDLQGTDDTARAALADGDSDNITSATSWTLSGLYKNNSSHERDPDSDGVDDADGGSAGGVAGVEIRIRHLDENNQETDRRTVSVTTTQSDGAISKPSNLATGDYTFSTEFDVLSTFGANAPDGTYMITVKAANGAGEEGESSDPLTITLDRQAPVPDAYLVLRTQWYTDGIGGYRFHRFTVTDASNGESNGAVIAYDGGNKSRTLLPGTPKTIGSDDWSIRSDYEGYEVVYVDAAGNATDREAFPDYLKAPLITSYEIDQAAHKYLVTAGAQNNRALEGLKQFTYNSNYCDPDGAGITKTPYTPASVLTLPSDNVCVEATDGYGNTASILVRALAQPLITDFKLNEDGNDPDRSPTDFITNNTTLRLQGTILSGSTARLEIKESSQSWGDPSDPNDNFEGTELAIPTESINADTGVFEVTYEIPADYHGGTHTLEVRGYVETSGATEIGPITLHDIMYDAEAPAKPSQAPSLLADSDDTGILGDGITAKTENIDFQVRGEKEAIMTLSTGEMVTNPSSFGNAETINQIVVSSLTEGTHTITVTATDKAGNTSPPSDPFTLTIDPTAPEVTIVRLNDEDTTIDTDTRFITVANDETTVAFRVAAIAESACETATWTTTGSAYTSPEQFNPNTAFSAVTNGACFIARDAAYNIATKHSDDAIEGVGDARITGATKEGTTFYTKSGQRELTGVTASGAKVLIKITADEPTAFTGTQLRDTGFANHAFDMGATATTFAEVITIPSGADGQKLIAWIWTDKSDHTTATPAITLGTLIVDDTPATVTATAVRTSNASGTTAKQNDRLFLDITVNEIVQSATVTLAGITATEADCTVPSAADTQFTCSVTLSNEAHEGAARAEWTLRDRAGNETTGTLTSEIIIDATAPAVTVTSSRGMLVSVNDVLTLNLGVTDTNGITAGTYAFSATGGTLATCEVTATAGQKSAATSCTLTVTATGDGTPVILTVPRFTDTPGNEKAQHTRTIARVDTTAPTLSAITDQDSTKKKKFSFTLEAVHNQHIDNRDIPETLTPLLGGDCEDLVTSAKFTAQTPDTATKTYTATATAPKGTYEACTITLQDEAGNKSATLTFTEFTIKGSSGIGRISGALFKKIQSFFSGGNRDTTSVFNPAPSSAQRTTAPSAKIVPVALPARIAATCILGETHEHVRAAQILLNQTFCPVAASGPGSPGQETTYFGSLTQQAITCFQRAQGRPEDGILTPQFYIALLSVVRAGAAAPPARQTPTPEQRTPTSAPQLAPAPVQPIAETPGVTIPDRIAGTHILGETHEHVRAAQILFNQTSCPVTASGPGSPGRETVYFGPLTHRAVTCFQRTQGRPEDGILTPRLYAALHSTVYPTTPPADTDQQEDRRTAQPTVPIREQEPTPPQTQENAIFIQVPADYYR